MSYFPWQEKSAERPILNRVVLGGSTLEILSDMTIHLASEIFDGLSKQKRIGSVQLVTLLNSWARVLYVLTFVHLAI